MDIDICEYKTQNAAEAACIWNEIVRAGNAFPQETELSPQEADSFFRAQSFTAIARDIEKNSIVGLYILHPNNIGRCGHLANASYAVDSRYRGQHIGELLVKHCIAKAGELGFRILHFNAVVAPNVQALKLYKKLGFVQLGIIPGGFRQADGTYIDIIPHYIRTDTTQISEDN